MKFELGQPFRPYQQLMGVLPDRSKRIVPTPYHELMISPESPIIDFYPRDFELDMNGKKMDWEAVVKIPFIDEQRLLAAMKPKDSMLSEAEKTRNEFGVTLKYTYSSEMNYIYPSSFPGLFPDIQHCHCVENIFDLPTIEELDIYVGLMEGAKLGQAALAGFPTLKTLPHIGDLDFHGTSIFQQESRNESMVITMLDSEKRAKTETAKSRLGHKVYVGYPFLAEAKVIRVSDELFSYELSPTGSGPPIAIPHGPQEIDMWRRKAERIEGLYSKRLGMVIGPVESIVHVDMLKGLIKTNDGATIKEYAHIPSIETDYASQMVVEEVESEDLRFIEQSALPIQDEFPIGTRAFFLGEFNYGRPLEVVGHSDNKADIWVSTMKGKVSEFGRDIVAIADRLSPYTPSFAVAKMLQLSPLVLSKITSAFQVNFDESRVNLGLNLKFEAKKLKVLGYSRRGSTGWEYSEKAIELLQQYMVRFPEFIAGIMRNPQGNTYEATDFYTKAEAKAKIREIQLWLKSIESKNFGKVPLEAAQLDSDVVQKIEEAAQEAVNKNSPDMTQSKRIKDVPRNALLKPSDAEHRLGHQRFALGDRVVYVQDSGRVPIATQGTVVGMTQTSRTTLLDVVFDVTFMSGTSLEDRCSPFRGSTVPIHSVLNITNKQVIAESRAGDSHRLQSKIQSLPPARYGVPEGPDGQGQLVPAQTPLPLRGSFREAVLEQQINNRGGGMSRGGMSHNNHNFPNTADQGLSFRSGNTDFRKRSDRNNQSARGDSRSQPPAENRISKTNHRDSGEGAVQSNYTLQSQSYSQVPPPASLNARGRGRGRGGARGGMNRGDGLRGRSPLKAQETISSKLQ